MAKYSVTIDAELYDESDEAAMEQAKDLAARLVRPEGEAFVTALYNFETDEFV